MVLRPFTVGLAMGLALWPHFVQVSIVSAEHLNTGCDGPITWVESVDENFDRIEDGVHALIDIDYPPGGPVDTIGELVRSVFAERNFDNKAEVGWIWQQIDGRGDVEPTRFWFYRNAGKKKMGRSGSAGNLGESHQYRLNNDKANHWLFRADSDTIHEFTFDDLNAGLLNYAQSEVGNTCDSAAAHFKNLMDKDCDDCLWKDWTNTENYEDPFNLENPCYHTTLTSDREFKVVHGSGPNETCQGI